MNIEVYAVEGPNPAIGDPQVFHHQHQRIVSLPK